VVDDVEAGVVAVVWDGGTIGAGVAGITVDVVDDVDDVDADVDDDAGEVSAFLKLII